MSIIAEGLRFQASASDVIITWIGEGMIKPITMVGFDEQNIIEMDGDGEVENTKTFKTADGATVGSVGYVMVKGTLTLQWNSPSRVSVDAVRNAQNADKLIRYGTLNIALPSALNNINYQNAVFTGVPTGPNLNKDGIQAVKISFKADVPNNEQLGAFLAAASS